MRRFIVLLLTISALPGVAAAQNTPMWELSTGYQYTRVSTGAAQNFADSITAPFNIPSVNVGRSLSINGGNIAIEENVNSWWGGVFDFSGTYATKHIDLSPPLVAAGLVPPGTSVQAIFRPTLYTFTGGPQFHYRRHPHFQPFARILLGAALSDLHPDDPTASALKLLAPDFRTARNSFAVIAGAGADYSWKHYLAFRVSADFLRTYLFDEHQGNLRITAGAVFKFGHK
jgi:hypothetical protein